MNVNTFVQIGQKQRVDQCRLAKARLAHRHHREFEALFDWFAMDLIGQIGKSNEAANHLEAAALAMERKRINFATH